MEPKETPTPIPTFAPLESADDEEEEDEDVDAGDEEVELEIVGGAAAAAVVVGIVVEIEELVVVVVGSPEPSVWAIDIALSVPQQDEESPQHQVDELAVPSQGVMATVELERPTPGF